jgi:hypothetical protein
VRRFFKTFGKVSVYIGYVGPRRVTHSRSPRLGRRRL